MEGVVRWTAPTDLKGPCLLPNDFDFVGLCTAGCVTPDQEILSPFGSREIVDLEEQEKSSVLVHSFNQTRKI